jgi:carboxymethylenebutenolidase
MSVPGVVANPEALRTDITFESDGATIEAYLARPAEPGQFPGLIVIHEAFGPVEHIRDVARRFAAQGFVAIAPNLYSRIGKPNPEDINDVVGKMFELPDEQATRDLEGAAAYLRADGEVTGKVGCIGFCSGGRQTLLFACSSDVLDAAVDCWGGLITAATFEEKATTSRPTPPIELAGNLRCPLLAVFGAEDDNPSTADAEQLKHAVEQSGRPVEVRIFENAGHAFFADYRPTYVPEAAQALWPVILDFLGRHLRG